MAEPPPRRNRSPHSEVERLGPPPPPPTAEERELVGKILDRAFGNEKAANVRDWMDAMLFDSTTLSAAPEAAPWHPKRQD